MNVSRQPSIVNRHAWPSSVRLLPLAICLACLAQPAFAFKIVSPAGGAFSTPVDHALAALGLRRQVVLSAASFLFVPDIVSRSDLVALVPERLRMAEAEL